MADPGDQASLEPGSKPSPSEKLPRAHKRCINKDCREVLSLATKVRAAVGLPGGRVVLPPARHRPPPRQAPQQAALSICSRALSLPQYCKKCNAVQFERKASKNRSTGGEEVGAARLNLHVGTKFACGGHHAGTAGCALAVSRRPTRLALLLPSLPTAAALHAAGWLQEGKRIPKRKSADSSGSEEDMEEDESEVEEEAARQGGQTTAAAAAAAPRFDTGFTNIPQVGQPRCCLGRAS